MGVQVVAGLKQHISREELTGRLVAVVLNLKPAKLAGELSEAMILAADHAPVSAQRGRVLWGQKAVGAACLHEVGGSRQGNAVEAAGLAALSLETARNSTG